MKTGEDEYRYKKVRSIRERLVNILGAKYARLIDHEMNLIEELFAQGRSFEEITQAVQARLPGHQFSRSIDFNRTPGRGVFNPILQELSPSRQAAYWQPEPHRSASPTPNIFQAKTYDHFDQQRRRFERDSQQLVRKFEQSREANFPIPQSLEYYAKLDEVKALEALKSKEEHLRAIEELRLAARLNAEKDNEQRVAQQIQEKQLRKATDRAKMRELRATLDERELRMRYYESMHADRERQKKQGYAQALDQQVHVKRQLKQELDHLKSIEKDLSSRGYSPQTPGQLHKSFNSSPGSRHFSKLGSSMINSSRMSKLS